MKLREYKNIPKKRIKKYSSVKEESPGDDLNVV